VSDTFFSILIFILGVIIGLAILALVNFLKNKGKEKTANSIISSAKKEADKIKRDSIFETKEEINKLKLDAEKNQKNDFCNVKKASISVMK